MISHKLGKSTNLKNPTTTKMEAENETPP